MLEAGWVTGDVMTTMMVQLTGWRREMMRAGVVVVRRAESREQLQYRDQVSTRISAVRHSSSQHLEDHQNMASFRMVSLNVEYTNNIQDINYVSDSSSGSLCCCGGDGSN